MLLTVEGTYRDGEIELAETPENVEQANVLVTFLKIKKNPGTPPPSVSSPGKRRLTKRTFVWPSGEANRSVKGNDSIFRSPGSDR